MKSAHSLSVVVSHISRALRRKLQVCFVVGFVFFKLALPFPSLHSHIWESLSGYVFLQDMQRQQDTGIVVHVVG